MRTIRSCRKFLVLVILATVVYPGHANCVCNDSSKYPELPETEEQTDIPSWELRDLNENKTLRSYSAVEDIAQEQSFTGTEPNIESPEFETNNQEDDDHLEPGVTTDNPGTIEETAVYETNYSNETDSKDVRRRRSAQ